MAGETENRVSNETTHLDKEIRSQVADLASEAEQVENSEVQSRVEHLIGLIKDSLRSRHLNAKTQKELARLLSLTPNLNSRHIQQLNLLDLAVSTLLETGQAQTAQNPTQAQEEAQERNQKKVHDKNLVFVQETRRQIAQQSRAYPHVLRSIFVTGGGTPYIRLISGLSWFFLIFVILPVAVVGATLLTHAVALDVADYQEAIDKEIALTEENEQLKADKQDLQEQVRDFQNQQNYLIATLGQTNSQLSELSETVELRIAANNSDNSNNTLSQFVLTQSALDGIIDNLETKLNAETLSPNAEAAPPNAPLRRSATPDTAVNTPAARPSLPNAVEAVGEVTTGTLVAAESILTDQFSLILLAVAMGALGSTISVIVRANTFINQAQETENDLFLTGFFRPFVGMSFAIFCVALVEAGIFSGIFDINRRDNTDPIYFYVAIAFVAGFSERLVRDVVIKTEDTIAGPKYRD